MVSVPDGLGGGLEKKNRTLSAGAPPGARSLPGPAAQGRWIFVLLAGRPATQKTDHVSVGPRVSLNQRRSFEYAYT